MKKIISTALLVLTATTANSFSMIDAESFLEIAYQTESRCHGKATYSVGIEELRYARNKGLITEDAYDAGIINGFFPIIDRRDRITLICPFQS